MDYQNFTLVELRQLAMEQKRHYIMNSNGQNDKSFLDTFNKAEEWLDNSKEVDKVISKVPLKILFEADEIARFAKNILDLFASYTTGSDFIIDGGRSLV